ncbi:Oligopeptide transport ATP-binding protein OppD [Oceanobacillus oncorhynchi]|uniref:Oligopeptide transport ATP-binding protein OppD n=1 Tax=Oceanobacillus oncorhynchi TaxID=545501 RepID=A0A0A1MMZ8_9BACI|nr:Oligopeptide transport ATP-binding protein OppD [Oceanobacillus oncorhynchi]
MIAMALICLPKLLIADEPTTALDVRIQALIPQLMKNLQDKFNMSIILITHDFGIVAGMCDRIVVMKDGQIVEQNDTTATFTQPRAMVKHICDQIAVMYSGKSVEVSESEELYEIRFTHIPIAARCCTYSTPWY